LRGFSSVAGFFRDLDVVKLKVGFSWVDHCNLTNTSITGDGAVISVSKALHQTEFQFLEVHGIGAAGKVIKSVSFSFADLNEPACFSISKIVCSIMRRFICST
jgi:hypothetical protein